MIKKNKIEKKNIWLLPTLFCVWSFWFSAGQVWAAEPTTATPAPTDNSKPAEEAQPVNFSYVDLSKALSFQFEGQDFASFLDQKFDIQSFMNKPVRLPIGSDNPDGVPGGDQDFLYVYPPEFFFSEKTGTVSTIPSKIMYFGSGQKINDNRAKYFRKDLQKKVIQLLQEKSVAVESLRAVIVKQAAKRYRQVGLITDYSQKVSLTQSSNQLSLLERIFSLNEAKAEDTNATELTNLVSDLKNQISDQTSGATTFSQDDAIEKIIGSGDSQTREMLSLLLLLLIYKNALAEPQTDLKAQCVAAGGEWLNEACSVDTGATAGSNVTALGSKKICEESGGTWKTEYPMRKVCMAQCGAKDDDCTDRILAGEIANKGCVCPDGSCVTAVGDCLAQDASKTDKDEDEIPDGVDKCPKSKDVESGVSMNEQSDTYGCTCADLQAKGRIQQRQCPGAACDGSYMVTYAQSSGTDSCEMGNIIPFSCVANRTADQNCQKAAESDKNKNDNKSDNMDWMKMLQQLMQGGGGSGGGSGGGGSGGGGGGGGGQPNTGGDPASTGPSSPTGTKPTGTGVTPITPSTDPLTPPSTFSLGQKAIDERSSSLGEKFWNKNGPSDKLTPTPSTPKIEPNPGVNDTLDKARGWTEKGEFEVTNAKRAVAEAQANVNKIGQQPGQTLDDLAKAQQTLTKAKERLNLAEQELRSDQARASQIANPRTPEQVAEAKRIGDSIAQQEQAAREAFLKGTEENRINSLSEQASAEAENWRSATDQATRNAADSALDRIDQIQAARDQAARDQAARNAADSALDRIDQIQAARDQAAHNAAQEAYQNKIDSLTEASNNYTNNAISQESTANQLRADADQYSAAAAQNQQTIDRTSGEIATLEGKAQTYRATLSEQKFNEANSKIEQLKAEKASAEQSLARNTESAKQALTEAERLDAAAATNRQQADDSLSRAEGYKQEKAQEAQDFKNQQNRDNPTPDKPDPAGSQASTKDPASLLADSSSSSPDTKVEGAKNGLGKGIFSDKQDGSSDFWTDLQKDNALIGNDMWNDPNMSKSYSDRMFEENIALDETGFESFKNQVQPGFDNSGIPNESIGEYVGTPSSPSVDSFFGLNDDWGLNPAALNELKEKLDTEKKQKESSETPLNKNPNTNTQDPQGTKGGTDSGGSSSGGPK